MTYSLSIFSQIYATLQTITHYILLAILFESVASKLENDLEMILDWFFRNNMVANPGKFQLMFLGMKGTEHLGLNINGQIIRASDKVKLLGVTIDKKLTFGQHIEELCTKVSIKVKAFSRL